MQSRRVFVDPRLLEHVRDTSGLTEPEARRVVEDVIAFLAEPLERRVRRRHAELKTRGWKNDAIFAEVQHELAGSVVAAPELSQRQLRRVIYT